MANKYWVGGTNIWDATPGAKRSLTSGGPGGAPVPTNADNVFFDANSAGVVTKNTNTAHISVDFTGFTGTFAGPGTITVSSYFTLGAGMTRTWTGSLVFDFGGNTTLTTNGIILASNITINNGTSLTLTDDCVTSGTLSINSGNFFMNGNNLTCDKILSGFNNPRIIDFSTGVVTLTGIGGVWAPTVNNLTFNAGTSEIRLTNNSGTVKQFAGQGLTYYNFWNNTGGTGDVFITGNNTWNTIKIDAGRVQRFTNTQTQSMVSLIANGTPGNNITIDSQGPATHTLNKIGGGTIQVNYCTITRSTAVQTLTWYANNSIDGGSNTNWIFGPAPGNFTPKVIAIV